jgi:hypothetical protein
MHRSRRCWLRLRSHGTHQIVGRLQFSCELFDPLRHGHRSKLMQRNICLPDSPDSDGGVVGRCGLWCLDVLALDTSLPDNLSRARLLPHVSALALAAPGPRTTTRRRRSRSLPRPGTASTCRCQPGCGHFLPGQFRMLREAVVGKDTRPSSASTSAGSGRPHVGAGQLPDVVLIPTLPDVSGEPAEEGHDA